MTESKHNLLFQKVLVTLEKFENWRKLRIYKRAVRQLANSRGDFILPNSSEKHATVVMCNIFRTAEKYICIFAGDLAGKVSTKEWRHELKKFLEKDDVKLKIILEKKPTIKSDAIKDILEAKKKDTQNKIEIGYSNDITSWEKLFDDKKKRHFTFADDRMYRIEEDTTNFIAAASFNRPDQVAILKAKFDNIIYEKLDENCFQV